MSASNKHICLRQAIASIKDVCARTIASPKPECQPLLHQEVISTKQNYLCYNNEKASARVVQVRRAHASRPRSEPDFTRKLTTAEYADMLHTEAMFHHMAMRL
ncbi:hypothetical protein QM012_007623 [Aureobasidium pullulans]|uniref:Uncharacterized protein n=1 Tax=Aureobasidium pullulans TaxID=5580 RepID=A0ABR0TKA7_AURPU